MLLSPCISLARQAPWAASALLPAAVPCERDPALQQRGTLMFRQLLLPGWGLIEVLLMHEDVNNEELQMVARGLELCHGEVGDSQRCLCSSALSLPNEPSLLQGRTKSRLVLTPFPKPQHTADLSFLHCSPGFPLHVPSASHRDALLPCSLLTGPSHRPHLLSGCFYWEPSPTIHQPPRLSFSCLKLLLNFTYSFINTHVI